MQAYLQQYSFYPPFITDRSKRPCDMFIICRFESAITFRKFIFRWSKVLDPKFSFELIALFYENDYSFDRLGLNERTIKKEVDSILGPKRSYFKVLPIFFGEKKSRLQDKVMDLKILGDEVCFQSLRRKYKKQYFLYTSEYCVPNIGLPERLIALKTKVEFHAEGVHLPEISFEFSEADIQFGQKNLLNMKDSGNKIPPHLLFSTNAYINMFGKSPEQNKFDQLCIPNDSLLVEFLKMDTACTY
jgi:hypothetical protein